MPTRKGAAVASAPAHFPGALRSLAELEAWHDEWTAAGRPSIEPVVPYRPRQRLDGPLLLVCDDTLVVDDADLPWKRAWTFEHRHLADSYVFFAHRRVAVPPHETVTACHRAGVKCFGTFVLEGGEARDEAIRLLQPRTHGRHTSPLLALQGVTHPENPFRAVETRYADMLVDLVIACGFEGLLLNVELSLGVQAGQAADGAPTYAWSAEHAYALLAWVEYLRDELARRVPGGHGQLLWYDSVTHSGRLQWQSRINQDNVRWMLGSDGFFTVRRRGVRPV